MMIDLFEPLMPLAASARSSWGIDSPPIPKPPILRNPRRDTPSQKPLEDLPKIVSIRHHSMGGRGKPAVHQGTRFQGPIRVGLLGRGLPRLGVGKSQGFIIAVDLATVKQQDRRFRPPGKGDFSPRPRGFSKKSASGEEPSRSD